MGTWEEESSALLESQNEISKDVSSDGTYCDGNDVDVKVEVVNVNGNGDECGNENYVVTEEGALVQQLERVELQNNGSDCSKIEEEKREEHGEYDDNEGENLVYPLRPYAVDCSFYIKTGTCKFGQNCRYNHPERKGFQPVGEEKGFEERIQSVGDAGKIECKYYQTPGGCKYGDACRYNHSACRIEKEQLELNFLGLPIRPSAQECTFYLQNGSCAYGANCRFHHPYPSATKEYETGDSLVNGKSVRGGISLPRNYAGVPLQSFGEVSQGMSMSPNGINLRNGAPYSPEMSSYHRAMPQTPGLNQRQSFGEVSRGTSMSPNGINLRNGPPYSPEMSSYHRTMPQTPGLNQSEVISSSPANKFPLPHQVMNNVSKRVAPLAHYESPMQVEEFPERPGQPDCDYFIKTGNCKYRSACRYNHPTSQMSKLPLPPFSSKGLYSRPPTVLPARASELLNSNSSNMRNNVMSSTYHQNRQMQNGEFPERAGQPECEYYMKTGQCKFKSACRYDHPRSRVPSSSHCALSEKGLPLRPGAKLCRNYEQQGKCKYGRNCLFNHPDDFSPDVPVAGGRSHSSTNISSAANLEPPVANVNSSWDDGWGM